jgi:AhpD family alkylhydroperoxidase
MTTLSVQERRAAARVPLLEGTGLLDRVVQWYSRRTYGDVLDNGLALMHDKRVLWSVLRFEQRVARWKLLDPDLTILAQMAAAARIGCSWCVDFGWYAAHSQGRDTSRLREVPSWRRPNCSPSSNAACWSRPKR